MSADRIAVVCSTYRNPEKPSLTRLYGIMSLIDQVRNQSLQADTRIVIVDDSAEKHPFVEGLGNALGDDLMYFHVPSRNNLPRGLAKKFNYAAGFFPKDADFQQDPFWKTQLQEVKAWESFLPFDYEFAKKFKIDMAGQLLAPRPTIGMKKNFGCAAYAEAAGSVPDVFVYVDDDDLRSPDYLRIVRDGIQGFDFARVTKTLCHNVSPEAQHRFWGEIDFQVQKDINGNWFIPPEVMDSRAYKYEDGILIDRPVHDLYQRNLLLAWPIISHDGALHNYTGAIWERAAKEFGGFFPTSFSEDIITHKKMSRLSGFRDAKIEVAESPFIRCSDGRNASEFYCTKVVDKADVPVWANGALAPLYKATDLGLPYAAHEEILRDLGRHYAKTGQLDLSRIKPPAP
ncbi:MAG: hypothetical protein HYU57_01060 [Micavibrio aeruginosavorus]|nr:hypothetical protein [Micavibrio aeruginosavorus]